MKKSKIVTLFLMLSMLQGCNEPETIVTNIVHSDGSVTRHVEMRSSYEIDPNSYRVPVDSTWATANSIEVSSEGDTTWVIIAEKTFPAAESINAEYEAGEDVNSYAVRSTSFTKSFRWFVTVFRFAEKVERTIHGGRPLADYLSEDEMEFFVLPGSVSEGLLSGGDSLVYEAMSDRIDSLMYGWVMQGLVSGFVHSATGLFKNEGADIEIIDGFRSKEDELIESYTFEVDIDSLIPLVFRREYEAGYGHIIDSAIAVLSEGMDMHWSIRSYTLKTVMPGKLKGGNGYFTSSGEVAWQVKAELFLFDDYEMWAESYHQNIWAWIVSFGFLLLAISGMIFRKPRHRQGGPGSPKKNRPMKSR
ncbi:MAG: hypothetical protein R6W67_05020 [Bacteroidales bacterium]